jgi:hypothetical protein
MLHDPSSMFPMIWPMFKEFGENKMSKDQRTSKKKEHIDSIFNSA